MKCKIKVTQNNIDQGARQWVGECPIAWAIRDAGFKNPYVTRDYSSFSSGGSYYFFYMPHEAREFVKNFDNFNDIQPFEFEAESRLLEGA